MTTATIAELQQLCIKALSNAGLRDKDAHTVTDHFLENELSGKASHGMVRVVEAIKTMRKYGVPTQDPAIETDTGSMVVINANRQIGVVAGKIATDIAIERARQFGIALVGARDYIASSGSMAYYLRRLAAQGLVAIMGCNSVAMVAPPGGKQRVIGTNPVGFTTPTEGQPLIVDVATSAIAYGKLMVMKDMGEHVPDGYLIDKDGHPSTEPQDAYDGAILPLAGYKGFGLGLMIELLAGPLINAHAVKQNSYDNDGLFIIAIDPSKMGHNDFKSQIYNTLDEIRMSHKRPESDTITLPGDRSTATLETSIKRGTIDVADKTLSDIIALTKTGA